MSAPMTITMDTLAETIRVRREALGLRLAELAAASVVSEQTVGNLEQRYGIVKAPNLRTLARVIGALGGRIAIEWNPPQAIRPCTATAHDDPPHGPSAPCTTTPPRRPQRRRGDSRGHQ